MKKSSKLLAALLCGSLVAGAQDTYWALDGNKIFNTSTQAVTTSSLASPDFDYNADRSVIFNASAEALFTGGTSSNFTVSNLGQVLPIPTACKKYVSMEIVPQPTPHGHYLRVREIDATAVTNNSMTTGFPTSGSYTYLHGAADAVYWGAVAAKLNADGTRYIYHLNRPASSWTSTLNRYELNSAGVVNTTPTTLSTTLPPGGFLKMSPDGQAIGYINDNGNFVTYNIATNTATTYSTYSVGLFITPQEIPAIECAIVSGNRRWFLGNNSEVGFVTEGSSGSYTKISGTSLHGTKSSLALGRDGNIYYAFNSGGVSSGAGDLYYFNPASATGGWSDWIFSNKSSISGAKIATTHGSGSGLCYLFGNQVAGEDVNSATAPQIPPFFTVGGISSGNLVLCTNDLGEITSLILDAQQYGIASGYSVTVEEGYISGITGLFVQDGSTYNTGVISSTDLDPSIDLIAYFGALSTYNGHLRITFSTISPCGTPLSTTIIINLIPANAVVDFYMIGPEDCMSGSSVCSGHTPAGSTLSPLASPTYDGLQYRIDNIAHVNSQAPAQPVMSTTPPCADGWMGAASVGIDKGTLTHNNTTLAATNGYDIQIEEFDNSGTSQGIILHTNPTTFPSSGYRFWRFTTPRDYFVDEYETIKNNYYYKVTLTVHTEECGPYSKHSFFRIIDGQPCGEYYKPGRTTGVNGEMIVDDIHVFPNPASGIVNLSWAGKGEEAQIIFINTLGQTVLTTEFAEVAGVNNKVVDVSNLTPGLYQYILTTSGGEYKGKIVKQ